MIRIGVTTRERNDKNQYFIPEKYVLATRHAGGLPLLIPHGGVDPGRYIDCIDGLLMIGGGDIDPIRYRCNEYDLCEDVNDERDESEFLLVQAAIEAGLPILGVCRGMQLINVIFGGTLHPHLSKSNFDREMHGTDARNFVDHDVAVAKGTKLYEIIGSEHVMVKSKHHQGIDQLGEGLIASGHAPDGLIEAIEHEDHPNLLGVQWHPEYSAEAVAAHQGLFNFLVSCAAKNK